MDHISEVQPMFISELDNLSRVKLFRHALKRFSANELTKAFDKSKSTIYRYAKGEVIPNDEAISKLLTLIPFEDALAAIGNEIMKAFGLVDPEGRPRLIAVISLLSAALGDPLLRKIVLEWVARALGNEVLSLKPQPALLMRWEEGFERWLLEEKGISAEYVKYYRSLFLKHFEGEVLDEALVERASDLPDWARVVFRHYLKWLMLERKVDSDFAKWALKKVPSRRYKVNIAVHEISIEEVREALEVLKEENRKVYWLYRLMLESGLRLAHALELVANWSPSERVYVEPLKRFEEQCKCFERHCRCWMGLKRGKKSALWAFMSKETFEALSSVEPITNRSYLTKKAKKLGIIEPSKLRKFAEHFMKEAFAQKAQSLGEHPETLMQFIQGRVGELKVSHVHYDNLLRKADLVFPKWLEWLERS